MRTEWQIVVCMTALFLVAASPLPPPPNQQSGQSEAHQAVAKLSPQPTIETPTQPKPSFTPQRQSAATKTKYSPEQSRKAWLLWILARIWKINWSNWALVFAAIWAGRIALNTLCAIRDQAEIARKALTFLETPRISIGKLSSFVRQPDSRPYPRPQFRFSLKNDGRSVAELTSVCPIARVVTDPSIPVNYDGGLIDTSQVAIGPNSDTGEMQWRAIVMQEVNEAEFAKVLAETAHIVLFGYVKYVDVFGQKWISGFGWRWHPKDGVMYLIGGRNYNYARKDEQNTGLSKPE
jgi:hypothetical protein